MYTSIYAAVASQSGSRPALMFNDRAIRYDELIQRAETLAAALAAASVGKGDRVCVLVDKSPDAVALFLACLRSGAVFTPLSLDYTPSELDYLLGNCDPALVVCQPGREDALPCAGVPVRSLGNDASGSLLQQAAPAAVPAAASVTPDDVAAILYTSGTTGRPKGAMLTQGNVLTNALALIDAWRITSDDRLIHALPLNHTHGLFVALSTTLLSGACTDLMPRFDVDQVIRRMPSASLLMGVPTYYFRLLAKPELKAAVKNMRLFVSGSAPLSATVHRQFLDATGHAILERYGMTETGMIASNPYDGERRPGSVGSALPGIELRVTDASSGDPLPNGEVGAVEVRGPNVFKGYWRDPEKTAAGFRADGFFVTGDLGCLGSDDYLSLAGRQKDLIITGGLNVYPAEVEAVIDEIAPVAENAVIGVPDDDFGEAVVAIIAPRSDETLDADSIRTRLKSQLANYKQPKRIVIVDSLPRNKMGKIDKNELRNRYRESRR